MIEFIGWGGSILILLGYSLLSQNKKRLFTIAQCLSVTGATMVCVYALSLEAWPVLGLNIIWIIIAVKSLLCRNI